MRALEFITGHVIYNLAYKYVKIPTETHHSGGPLLKFGNDGKG